MNAQEYFNAHGINADSIKKFGLTFDEEKITIPIKNEKGELLYNKYRLLNSETKYKFDPGSHPVLYNLENVENSKYVILTEGEMDTIRLNQEGIAAISTTAGAQTFKEEWVKLLEGKRVVICYDSDKAGQEGTLKVVKKFPKISIVSLPEETKDICEYFQTHTKEEFRSLVNNAIPKEQYLRSHTPLEYSAITAQEIAQMEFPEEEWIVEKVVPQQGIVMFVGESGAGKSFIALDLVRSISNYSVDNLSTYPQFLDHFPVKTSVPILIIDKENGLRRIKHRLQYLGVPPSDQVFLLRYPELFNLENQDFMDAVKNLIEEQGIKLVILDSFIDIMLGNENSSVDTNQVFNALRSISAEVCWFLLHHDSKPIPKFERSASQRTRGSSNILAQVDLQFYLDKTKTLNQITIEQGKSRDNEPVKKFVIEFQSDPEGNMTGFKYMGEFKDDVSKLKEAISLCFDFIKEHPGSCKDDIDAALDQFDIKPRVIKDALNSLKKQKLLDFYHVKGHRNKEFYTIIEDTNRDVNRDVENEDQEAIET